MNQNDTITAIDGIRVGHATDLVARTGCTVVLCEAGAVTGVDVRGSAPGTRETDAIRPGGLVQRAHAVLLTGGSAFGLDAASGVMQYLEERNVGFPAGNVRVPIVPAAVIFDLRVGDPSVRPNREMGYQACVNATNSPVEMGQVGAGTGATVGKISGFTPSDGGLGSACIVSDSGVAVGAIVVINPVGNVVQPNTGEILAGAKDPKTGEFVDVAAHMTAASPFENTTIGVIATNVALTPVEATKVAQMAHDGLAQVIRPVHTMFDGDTIFALSIGNVSANVNTVGIMAVEATMQAVLRAVRVAT